MIWLALAYALQHADAQPARSQTSWTATGRVVDGPVHVGLRPALFVDPEGAQGLEWGIGATLQVTADP